MEAQVKAASNGNHMAATRGDKTAHYYLAAWDSTWHPGWTESHACQTGKHAHTIESLHLTSIGPFTSGLSSCIKQFYRVFIQASNKLPCSSLQTQNEI
jgi:hypothetical protein